MEPGGSLNAETNETSIEGVSSFAFEDDFESLLDGLYDDKEANGEAQQGVAPEFTQLSDAEREFAREKTIEQLKDYYGDQTFTYTKYHGTISTILSLCPPVMGMVDQGFDAVVAWADPFKDAEEKSDEDAKDDEKANKDESEAVAENPVTAPVAEKAAPPEKKGVMKSVVEAVAVVAAVSAMASGKKEASKTTPVEEVAKADPADTTQELASQTVEAEVEPAPEFVPAPAHTAEATPKKELRPAEASIEVTGVVEIAEAVEMAESTQVPQEKVVTVEVGPNTDAVLNPGPELEEVLQVHEAVLIEENEEIEEATEIEADSLDAPTRLDLVLESEMESIVEEEVTAAPSDFVELSEHTEYVENTEFIEPSGHEEPGEIIAEYFEDWHELAEEDAPLEELIVSMTEQLKTFDGAQEVSEVEESFAEEAPVVLEADEAIEMLSALPTKEIPDHVQPELFALLVSIQHTRETVENLYRAKTKEECKIHITQITIELSEVLRDLGYANPEEIIKAFLYGHSPEYLKDLVQELENMLRRAVVREVRHRRFAHAKNRHVRLRKVVGYVMRALTPKRTPATELELV